MIRRIPLLLAGCAVAPGPTALPSPASPAAADTPGIPLQPGEHKREYLKTDHEGETSRSPESVIEILPYGSLEVMVCGTVDGAGLECDWRTGALYVPPAEGGRRVSEERWLNEVRAWTDDRT